MDRAHVFHSWSAQRALQPLPIASAEGCWFWDYDGKRYLDFSSQLVNTNIGHQHPRVTAAIAAQAAKLAKIAPQHANAARGEAATRIAGLAPDGMEKVLFTNGGADAIENAIRMARRTPAAARRSASTAPTTGTPARRSPPPAMCGAGRTSSRPGTCISSGRTCTARRSGPLPSSRNASGRCSTWSRSSSWRAADDRGRAAGVHRRHRRGADSAAGLPGGRPGTVRPVRHRVHRR